MHLNKEVLIQDFSLSFRIQANEYACSFTSTSCCQHRVERRVARDAHRLAEINRLTVLARAMALRHGPCIANIEVTTGVSVACLKSSEDKALDVTERKQT